MYILRCADGTLYTGVAIDVARRFEEHQSQGPKGAKYTRGRGPLKLEYQSEIGTRSEACAEEYRIKQLSRSEKEALLAAG
ncbi:MAG: GIY-YIG nuclease family protein [Opitutaceae bacterium]